MMSRNERVGMVAVSAVVVVALLVGAFALIVPLSLGASGAPNSQVASSGALDQFHTAGTCGQVPVPLHSAGSYAVLASSTVTSTGATAITGDLGLSPGTSVTGFPPGTITGIKNVTTPGAAGAEANLTIAYNNASARSNCAVSVAGNIGGQTLTPGLYKSTSSLAISSGDLTLSGGGNPNGVFIFQVASAFTTTSGRTVILSNGAQAGNVFWQIGSSATIGTTSTVQGTIMAHDSISMLTGSVLDGRAMAETGEVSLAEVGHGLVFDQIEVGRREGETAVDRAGVSTEQNADLAHWRHVAYRAEHQHTQHHDERQGTHHRHAQRLQPVSPPLHLNLAPVAQCERSQ